MCILNAFFVYILIQQFVLYIYLMLVRISVSWLIQTYNVKRAVLKCTFCVAVLQLLILLLCQQESQRKKIVIPTMSSLVKLYQPITGPTVGSNLPIFSSITRKISHVDYVIFILGKLEIDFFCISSPRPQSPSLNQISSCTYPRATKQAETLLGSIQFQIISITHNTKDFLEIPLGWEVNKKSCVVWVLIFFGTIEVFTFTST